MHALEPNVGVTLVFVHLGGERSLDANDLALDPMNVSSQRIDGFGGFDVHNDDTPILTSSGS